jgi:periplasmic protein TonB
METNKILSADVLDIIFEGKNKAYGAYQLRKSYRKTLGRALIITGFTLLLALGGTVLANIINDNGGNRRYNVVETTLKQLNTEDPAPPPPPPPPPPPVEQPKMDIKQIRFTPPVIVRDEDVKSDEVIRELEPDAAISTKDVKSNNTNQVVLAPVDETDTKVVEVKRPDEENKIFIAVEIEAGFPGGQDAWVNYLRNTLNGNLPVDNGAAAGKYTVIVKFVVSKDGSVSDVKCENDPGFGMCEEAVRVIRRTKNWTPAVQNGQPVNAYRRQPVVFVVED